MSASHTVPLYRTKANIKTGEWHGVAQYSGHLVNEANWIAMPNSSISYHGSYIVNYPDEFDVLTQGVYLRCIDVHYEDFGVEE